MIVSLEEAKAHLRVQHDEEDGLITSLIEQAQRAAEDFCRTSFETDPPGPVKLAVLLMAGYYYENRAAEESAGFGTMRRAFISLLYPYRVPDKFF